MGVDCFKTDFGERIPTEVVYYDGSDPFSACTITTPSSITRRFSTCCEDERGAGEVGSLCPLGDGRRTAVSPSIGAATAPLPLSRWLRACAGGCRLGLSGFGFWSHDIGGFEQTAAAEVYKRWCAFGLFSSHSRLHGSSSYRVPWLFDEEAVDVLRFFTKLKCSLMPYLFGAAVQAHQAGIPVMRAMHLEFPTDPACDTLDRQYMLGDALLVAPVFTSGGQVDFYLPAGRWTEYLTGEVREGGRWLRQEHNFLSLPLLVRPNTLLAVGALDDRPDYDFSEGVTLQLFELEDGASAVAQVPALNGETALTVMVRRTGSQLSVTARGNTRSWRLLLRGATQVASLSAGTAEVAAQGVLITPPAGAEALTIDL